MRLGVRSDQGAWAGGKGGCEGWEGPALPLVDSRTIGGDRLRREDRPTLEILK